MQQDLDGAVLPVPSARPHTTRARTARLLTFDRAIAIAMVAPSLIAVAVFVYGFIGRTVYISLNNLAGNYSVQWNIQMVGALMAALPTLLVYVLLGRFFLRGMLAGSLKG